MNAILVLFILFSPFAIAGNDLWSQCGSDIDCIVADDICGRKAAINNTFRNQFQSDVKKRQSVIRCVWEKGSRIQDAYCFMKRCTLKNPEQ